MLRTILETLAGWPWLMLGLAALPFALLLALGRITPTPRGLAVLAVPALASLLLLTPAVPLPSPGGGTISLTERVVLSAQIVIILILDGMAILLLAIDTLTLPRKSRFQATRLSQRVVSLLKPHAVELEIVNRASRAIDGIVKDDLPEFFEAEPPEQAVRLMPQQRLRLAYRFTARRRGEVRLGRIDLRVTSRFGLWKRDLRLPCPGLFHVYPDLKQLGEYAILARTSRINQLGVRRTRRVGQDNEFERLRDYTRDDNPRMIEWRATARRNKLTVKDFQANQSQRILFLVDCGRMMVSEADGVSLLDHALNSMLMLSYVALSRGDSVGMLMFSDRIHSFLPPRSGPKQLNNLLHAGYNQFPQLVESRYDEAFVYLSSHAPKRSLVILITSVVDEVNAHQIHRQLRRLVGRHLPLGVILRDRSTFAVADQPAPEGEALFAAAAAADLLVWRHHQITSLQHAGVLTLDVFPDELTAPLVNEYLSIKARHLL